MMPMTREQIEILLDSPDRSDYVVSAYADLTVTDGFARHVERHLRNEARAAGAALSEAEARKALEANIEAIRGAVRDVADRSAKGLAIFSSVGRKMLQVVPTNFPVANYLVVDDEPYVLPLLEHWHGEPGFLVALVDSDEAHLFETRNGTPEPAEDLERSDAGLEIQRDKPRFTYKKRFAHARHERLHGTADDQFLHEVAGHIDARWRAGDFAGLILFGHSQITGPLRTLLGKEAAHAVVEESPLAMNGSKTDIAGHVADAVGRWRTAREADLLRELAARWKENHLIANGPTDVLDALQQGRATQVVIGGRRDMPGARCVACGYRFGAPSRTCAYCQGPCHNVNAVQEIMRMALRHKVPVELLHRENGDDPTAKVGGVVALLRAAANWAPDPTTAQASMGH